MMRRGDVVAVAAAGDHEKPRPAVIVQSDAFPEKHRSVIICQMTSDLIEGSLFRVTIEPSAENGLRARSQVLADQPTTVRRQSIVRRIGRLTRDQPGELNAALAFAIGLSD
jgi:mRNA interferase MazF